MIERNDLTRYLHQYLECDRFNDYAPNGLQIQGRDEVSLICTAVTASQKVIEQAVAFKADALLVHHGYFWRGESSVLTGMRRQRIATILEHNLNLYAYHLPLDCHPSLGNNACLAQILGVDDVQMHQANKTNNLLWTGKLNVPIEVHVLQEELTKKLERPPLYVTGTDQVIERLAWCTGAAQDFIEDAHLLGVDAYLSGEISERTYYQAQELGIHYFACGHHATERYGIQALGEHLVRHFDLKHQFIDSDNPI